MDNGSGGETPPSHKAITAQVSADLHTKEKHQVKEIIFSSRLEQLKALLEVLADAIDQGAGARDLASLSKQYRETLKEIEEIEGVNSDESEIDRLLSD